MEQTLLRGYPTTSRKRFYLAYTLVERAPPANMEKGGFGTSAESDAFIRMFTTTPEVSRRSDIPQFAC